MIPFRGELWKGKDQWRIKDKKKAWKDDDGNKYKFAVDLFWSIYVETGGVRACFHLKCRQPTIT